MSKLINFPQDFDALQFIINIDETVTGITYFGYAVPGTKDTDAKWRIFRLTEVTGISKIRKADGDDKFDNIWDNRASLTFL